MTINYLCICISYNIIFILIAKLLKSFYRFNRMIRTKSTEKLKALSFYD